LITQVLDGTSKDAAASGAELISRLRAAPVSADPIADTVLEAIVRSSLAQIGLLNAQITDLERQFAGTLATGPQEGVAQHPAARGHHRPGRADRRARTAAWPMREPPSRSLPWGRAVPVTKAPGKSRDVAFRYTANTPALSPSPASPTTPDTAPPGRRPLPSSTGSWCSPPPRRPDPRPRLGPRHLGRLDPATPPPDTAANSGSSAPDASDASPDRTVAYLSRTRSVPWLCS